MFLDLDGEVEENDELTEIMSNVPLNGAFLSLAREVGLKLSFFFFELVDCFQIKFKLVFMFELIFIIIPSSDKTGHFSILKLETCTRVSLKKLRKIYAERAACF